MVQIQVSTQSFSEPFTKDKKDFYKALDEKQVSDRNTFWKNAKPFFSDKGVNSSNITLVERKFGEEKIANIMDNYFINNTKNLNLKHLDKTNIDIDMFEDRISIKKIHEIFPNIIPENFHFKEDYKDDLRKEIRNLNVKKSSRNTQPKR